MAREVVKEIKLQIEAGKATPAPPVGTALGPAGVNSGEFCTRYNEATRDRMGDVLPVVISVYDDRSFDFVIKTPPASFLIKKYAKIKKGAAKGCKEKVATLTQAQVREIAEIKLPDLNCYTVEEAISSIIGTARNMGVSVEGMEEIVTKDENEEETTDVVENKTEETTEEVVADESEEETKEEE